MPYADFAESVSEAKDSLRGHLTGIMLAASEADPKHWKAAQAVLDRLDQAGQYSLADRAGSLKPLPGNLTAAEFWQRFEQDVNERLAILAEHKRSTASLADAPAREGLLPAAGAAPTRDRKRDAR